ncbi:MULTISPECIES: hypothetical protein [Pseudomonas]|jgi:hypothetical protein|uniref:hypothetical protein n=1 Tax=Pseudomonas TaxID=286 RepID=UPI000F4AE34C|nr:MULTISPECIES: hypothetical protein [Pseudomonas]ROL89691.1 hypothetical protein BK637_10805 [Pseudomonas chlororaphis]RON90926.1 hypothetical protein BK635_02875 [Pseudomonas chlororaphis]WPO48176.1 hypothetical protein SHB59_03560 [Pseudomonas sp. S1Bt23]
MFINGNDNPRFILYSPSPGMLLKYWASLNAIGIYNVTPCSIWAKLMDTSGSGDRYDMLLYDHLGDPRSLNDSLSLLEERRVARQIMVLAHIDAEPRHQLLAWARDKGIALLDVAGPPMDSRALLGMLEKQVACL